MAPQINWTECYMIIIQANIGSLFYAVVMRVDKFDAELSPHGLTLRHHGEVQMHSFAVDTAGCHIAGEDEDVINKELNRYEEPSLLHEFVEDKDAVEEVLRRTLFDFFCNHYEPETAEAMAVERAERYRLEVAEGEFGWDALDSEDAVEKMREAWEHSHQQEKLQLRGYLEEACPEIKFSDEQVEQILERLNEDASW